MVYGKRSEAGLGLLELIIVTSLALVIAEGFVSLMLSLQVSGLARYEIVRTRQALSSSFLNQNFCSCNFKGLRWDTTHMPLRVDVAKIDTFQPQAGSCVPDNPALPWLQKNQMMSQTIFNHSVKVEDIYIEGFKTVGSSKYLVDLVVKVSSSSGGSYKPLRVTGVPLVTEDVPALPGVVEVANCNFESTDSAPLLTDSFKSSLLTPNTIAPTATKSIWIADYTEARRVLITNYCVSRGAGAEVLTYVRFLRNGIFVGEKYYGCNLIGPEQDTQSISTQSSYTALLPVGTEEIRIFIDLSSTNVTWGLPATPLAGQVTIDLMK